MNIKNENGSITLFVVIAMFAFVLFSLSTYTLLSRRNQTQQDLLNEIKNMYGSDSEYDEYASYFGGEIVPIYSAEDLKKVGSGETVSVSKENGKMYKFSADATYVLKNDINISTEWKPIGTEAEPFKGFFEGMGYKISGLYINNTSTVTPNQGLFGKVDGGIISNLEVEGTVTSLSDYVGGIVGRAENNYIIRNCSNKVIVTGNNYVGGIIGGDSEEGLGKIVNCRNNAIVNDIENSTAIQGKNNVGGIIGRANGNIINCANFSNVTSTGENVRWNCRKKR